MPDDAALAAAIAFLDELRGSTIRDGYETITEPNPDYLATALRAFADEQNRELRSVLLALYDYADDEPDELTERVRRALAGGEGGEDG